MDATGDADPNGSSESEQSDVDDGGGPQMENIPFSIPQRPDWESVDPEVLLEELGALRAAQIRQLVFVSQ